jgi:hypothetical protein
VTTAGHVAVKDYEISKPHFKVKQLLEHHLLMLIDFGLKRILHMRGLTCNSNYLRAIYLIFEEDRRQEIIRQVKRSSWVDGRQLTVMTDDRKGLRAESCGFGVLHFFSLYHVVVCSTYPSFCIFIPLCMRSFRNIKEHIYHVLNLLVP